jgi:hypothetical protein
MQNHDACFIETVSGDLNLPSITVLATRICFSRPKIVKAVLYNQLPNVINLKRINFFSVVTLFPCTLYYSVPYIRIFVNKKYYGCDISTFYSLYSMSLLARNQHSLGTVDLDLDLEPSSGSTPRKAKRQNSLN